VTQRRHYGFQTLSGPARQFNTAFGPTFTAPAILTSVYVRASYIFAPQDNPNTGYAATAVWGAALVLGGTTAPALWSAGSTSGGVLQMHNAVPEGFFAVFWAPDTSKAWVTGGWQDGLSWRGQKRISGSQRLWFQADDVSGAALQYSTAFSWDIWYGS
jgi:hypothetical protein